MASGSAGHDNPIEWRPGAVFLGQYEVKSVLGEGGMGRVYRVRHRGWHMDVAAKVPRTSHFTDEGIDAFERECQTWINLGLHPNTANCYYVKRFEGTPVVFAEFVAGGDLRTWIASGSLYAGGQSATLARILDIAIQTAWGLQHAHEHHVVHQDIKTANILLTPDGEAKITDFGIAKAASAAGIEEGPRPASVLVSTGGMTPAYCSPEQASGESLSTPSDVWSWGLMLLEMFAGEVFWVAGPAAQEALNRYLTHFADRSRMDQNRPAVRFAIPHMPEVVSNLLAQCFNFDPSGRPKDMGPLASYLENAYAKTLGAPYGRRKAEVHSEYLKAANRNNRAVSLTELGRIQEAVRLLRENLLHCTSALDVTEKALAQEIAFNLCLLQIRWKPSARVADLPAQIPRFPDAVKHAFLQGMLFLETGEIYEAIDSLGLASKRESAYYVDALNARGIALLLAGETQPAVLSFASASSTRPERLDIVRNLALAYYYDGQAGRARKLFTVLSESTIFDSEDTIRYATVLSAGGLSARARKSVEAALGAPSRSSAVLLTAAELSHGAQGFLPGVCPIDGLGPDSSKLVKQVIKVEPHNLRARIDEETLPARYGLVLGSCMSNNRRVLPQDPSPARLGGCMRSSYRALTKRYRWGDVPGKSVRFLLMLVSGLPAALVATLCTYLLTREQPHLAVPFGSGVFLGALFFTARGAPCNRLLRETLLLLPAVSLLVLGILFLFKDVPSDTRVLALSAVPVLLVVHGVWQFFYQHVTSVVRVFPSRNPIVILLEAWRINKHARTLCAGTSPTSSKAGKRGGAESIPFAERFLALVRRQVSRVSVGAIVFWKRSVAALREWQWNLLPQVVVLVILCFRHGANSTVDAYLPLLCFSLTLAPLSPRLMLYFNIFASVGTGILGGATLLDFLRPSEAGGAALPLADMDSISVAVCIALAALLLYFNWRAMRQCPEFVLEWTVCNPKPWDIRQVVDPLNIRRFAAPWQLIRLQADSETNTDGSESR